MRQFNWSPAFALLALMLLLAGCSSVPSTSPLETREQGALERTYYDVTIPSFDGTQLRATVFQPALEPGETAPLLIHAHGFGVFRMSGPISVYGTLIYSGIAAKTAWQNKYWVISYDARGHGQSDGMIRVMDPDYEAKDVSAIIDWATANIGRITPDSRGDYAIGMIGESYGGGAQLMGATLDKRIDALVPITTWNSFQTALTPDQVPKSGWLTTLILVGNGLNPGHMEPILNRAYWQARSGRIDKEIFDFLATHSPRYNCQNGLTPDADVLLVQGMRDVLFPLNEAKENYDCLANGKHDVRLIATQGGHLLPLSQWSWVPGYHVESTIHCDGKRIDMAQMAVDWFDEKLKKLPGKANYIPQICLTQDYDTGTTFKSIPVANQHFKFGEITVNNNFTGFFETPLTITDSLTGWVMPRMDSPALADHERNDTHFRPAFIPLELVRGRAILAGIPAMNIMLNAVDPAKEPIVYLGVAVKRAKTRKIELISDQITPIRGAGRHKGEMAGISTRLHKNDIIGLWVSGYSDQYRFSGGEWFIATKLRGEIGLPVFEGHHDEIAASFH